MSRRLCRLIILDIGEGKVITLLELNQVRRPVGVRSKNDFDSREQ